MVNIKPLASVMDSLLAEIRAQELSLLSTMNKMGMRLLMMLWAVDSTAALGDSHCMSANVVHESSVLAFFCFLFLLFFKTVKYSDQLLRAKSHCLKKILKILG